MIKAKVLLLCSDDSCRTQMPGAFLRDMKTAGRDGASVASTYAIAKNRRVELLGDVLACAIGLPIMSVTNIAPSVTAPLA